MIDLVIGYPKSQFLTKINQIFAISQCTNKSLNILASEETKGKQSKQFSASKKSIIFQSLIVDIISNKLTSIDDKDLSCMTDKMKNRVIQKNIMIFLR